MREPIGGQLELLTRAQLNKIHEATVEILERRGIKVWEKTAFGLFKRAGAKTNPRSMMVQVPENLLRDTLRKAPSQFYLHGRDPKYKLLMGKRRVHFSIAGQPIFVHDLDGRIRRAVIKDAEDFARIGDSCENIHHVSLGTVPADVPDDMHAHLVMLTNWKNSRKTTEGYNYGAQMALETVKMASILRGGEEELRRTPTLLGFVNPVSPLQLSRELIEGALIYAKYNQPVLYAPEALAGGTAPVTLAGLLVQQNAEVLSGIMVSQLANPGSPVLYGTVSAAMDMRTGTAALGGPEVGLLNVASAQLARFYGIPSRGTGGNTDSKILDAQAGIESAQSLLMASMAGMNFIYDAAGSLDGSLVLSKEKVVADNELCGMIARTLDGIRIDDETIATEEILEVGPAATFLSRPFTMKHLRAEHFIPDLLERRSREAWEKDGFKDIAARAREKAKRILREHVPEPMDREVVCELEGFISKTTRAHGH